MTGVQTCALPICYERPAEYFAEKIALNIWTSVDECRRHQSSNLARLLEGDGLWRLVQSDLSTLLVVLNSIGSVKNHDQAVEFIINRLKTMPIGAPSNTLDNNFMTKIEANISILCNNKIKRKDIIARIQALACCSSLDYLSREEQIGLFVFIKYLFVSGVFSETNQSDTVLGQNWKDEFNTLADREERLLGTYSMILGS